MRVLRWFAAAFSIYSRIPMPRFEWRDGDASHSLIFFPAVGALTGSLVFLANSPFAAGRLPVPVRVMVTVLIPLLVTGGFHLDGFMDTEDALRSYGTKEKKLKILKDPHIGAFAVIGLIRVLLSMSAALAFLLASERTTPRILGILGMVFVLSRCISALTSLLTEKAKREGMLYEETKGNDPAVVICLSAELAASAVFILYLDLLRGAAVCALLALYTLYYRHMVRREFGGVTGDTAGYCLVTAETLAVIVLAVSMLF